MRNVDVLIILEHKNRELESAVALKIQLEQAGFTAEIYQNMWGARYYSLSIKPKVVVVPWCYDDKDVNTYSVFNGQKGGRYDIINLHCEQITSSDASSFIIPTGLSKNVYHCAWGEYYKNLLIDSGVPEKKICITGSPRLDFFRPEFASYCQSKNELASAFGLNPKKAWILVVGNYSAAFLDNETIESLENRGIKHMGENSALAKATYSIVLEWLQDAMAIHDLREAEIIYRPHPSEPITEEILSIANRYDDFHVIKELAIREWFLNSDCAFMWNSTSSVEAAYANLPVFALRPIDIPSHLKFELLEYVEQIPDFYTFKEMLVQACKGKLGDCNLEFKNHISYYYQYNPESSAAVTAKWIASIINQSKGSFHSSCSPLYPLITSIRYWAKLFAYRTGLLGMLKKYGIVINDRVTSKDIEDLENAMKKALV